MEFIPLIAITLKGVQALFVMAEKYGRAKNEIDDFLGAVKSVSGRLEEVRANRIRLRNELLIGGGGSPGASSSALWRASITSRRLQAVLRKEMEVWDMLVKIDNRILVSLARRFKEGQVPRHGMPKTGKRAAVKMMSAWTFHLKKDADAAIPGLVRVRKVLDTGMKKDIQTDISMGPRMREANDEERLPAFAMMEVGEALNEAAIMVGQARDDNDDNNDEDDAAEAGIEDDDVDGGVDEETFEV